MRSPTSRLEHGLATLRSRGLGLHAVLRTTDTASVAPKLASRAAEWPSLVLVGSAGPTLWQSMSAARALEGEHPVNEYCEDALFDFCDDLEPDVRTRLLWPGPGADGPVPVTRLGELAGWSHRSPMGLGIHPRCGLWFAYRGLILLDVVLDAQREPASTSPCEACSDRPCLAACPPSAVGGPQGLDLAACLGERSRAGVDCNRRCLARAACPVGSEHRYPPEQSAHHQRFGTAAMRRAMDASARPPSEWGAR